MVIDVPLPAAELAVLEARATDVGKSVGQFVADAVARELSRVVPPADVTPAERLRVFEAFIAGLPKRDGVSSMDDSRESIYGDDGR